MTVNSMDERASTGMTPLVRRIETGMDGDGDGVSETTWMVAGTGVLSLVWWRTWCIRLALGLMMGMSVLPGIVLIAMSIEVAAEMRSFSGGVERGDRLSGLLGWVLRVCKRGITGAGGRADRSVRFAALHNG